MPIMTKANPKEPKAEYEIRDPKCREISGQTITPGQKTVWLTEREARFFLANGGISVMLANGGTPPAEAKKP